jgi:hypothetical protein
MLQGYIGRKSHIRFTMIPKFRQPFPAHRSRYLPRSLSGRAAHFAPPRHANGGRNLVTISCTSVAFYDRTTQSPFSLRTFSTSLMSRGNDSAIILPHKEVESLWFGGLNIRPGVAPSIEALVKRWFFQDHTFDSTCRCLSPFLTI